MGYAKTRCDVLNKAQAYAAELGKLKKNHLLSDGCMMVSCQGKTGWETCFEKRFHLFE